MFKMFQDYFYLNYDYSGANYYNEKHTGFYYGGIQGGFSLRKKSAMLECLDIDLEQMRTYRMEQYMKYLQRMKLYEELFSEKEELLHTHHEKILICQKNLIHIFEADNISQKLSSLEGVYDFEAYKKVIKELLPEYNSIDAILH